MQDVVAELVADPVNASAATLYGSKIVCWNVSLVTDMTATFYRQTDFNKNLGCWDTSSVTTMKSMFDGASNYNQPSLEQWNTFIV